MTARRVLGIFGSPRRGGNSDLLLEAALEAARSAGARVSTVSVRDLNIPGCRECGGCNETGRCVWNDGMQEVYPLLEDSDVIIMASPVFFYSFPSQLKALIDRAQAEWSKRYRVKKEDGNPVLHRGKGYLLVVGATRGKNLFVGIELTGKYFFDALGISYEGGIFLRGIDGKAEIKNHPEYLQQARELGARAAG